MRPIHLFALLVLFLARLILREPCLADALIALPLAALVAYGMFMEEKKRLDEPASEEMKKDIENLKGAVSALKLGKGLGR